MRQTPLRVPALSPSIACPLPASVGFSGNSSRLLPSPEGYPGIARAVWFKGQEPEVHGNLSSPHHPHNDLTAEKIQTPGPLFSRGANSETFTAQSCPQGRWSRDFVHRQFQPNSSSSPNYPSHPTRFLVFLEALAQ